MPLWPCGCARARACGRLCGKGFTHRLSSLARLWQDYIWREFFFNDQDWNWPVVCASFACFFPQETSISRFLLLLEDANVFLVPPIPDLDTQPTPPHARHRHEVLGTMFGGLVLLSLPLVPASGVVANRAQIRIGSADPLDSQSPPPQSRLSNTPLE